MTPQPVPCPPPPRRPLKPTDRRLTGGFAALPVEERRRIQDAGREALRARPLEERQATGRKAVETRKRNGNQRRGESHQSAKLSDAQVVEIRRLWDQKQTTGDGPSQGELATSFHVSRRRIGMIVRGQVRQEAGGLPPPTPAASSRPAKKQVAPVPPLVPAPKPTRIVEDTDESSLIRRYKAGDRAAGAALLKRYDGFIASVALSHRYRNRGLDAADLLQEGGIGFLIGVDRFDEDRGFKLVTYTTYWIREVVGRAVAEKGREVRVPVGLAEKLRRARRRGIETAEELVANGITDPARAAGAVPAMRRSLSLEAPHHGDSEMALGSMLTADTMGAEEQCMTAERETQVRAEARRLLATLSPRERIILEARVAVEDDEGQSLKQVGARLGISRERVRQIQEKALAKLRRAIGPDVAIFR